MTALVACVAIGVRWLISNGPSPTQGMNGSDPQSLYRLYDSLLQHFDSIVGTAHGELPKDISSLMDRLGVVVGSAIPVAEVEQSSPSNAANAEARAVLEGQLKALTVQREHLRNANEKLQKLNAIERDAFKTIIAENARIYRESRLTDIIIAFGVGVASSLMATYLIYLFRQRKSASRNYHNSHRTPS